MLVGSVRVTLVPAGSPASTVPTATSIALALIGAGIVRALMAFRTAIPLPPARSPRTRSVPGPYRRAELDWSFLAIDLAQADAERLGGLALNPCAGDDVSGASSLQSSKACCRTPLEQPGSSLGPKANFCSFVLGGPCHYAIAIVPDGGEASPVGRPDFKSGKGPLAGPWWVRLPLSSASSLFVHVRRCSPAFRRVATTR